MKRTNAPPWRIRGPSKLFVLFVAAALAMVLAVVPSRAPTSERHAQYRENVIDAGTAAPNLTSHEVVATPRFNSGILGAEKQFEPTHDPVYVTASPPEQMVEQSTVALPNKSRATTRYVKRSDGAFRHDALKINASDGLGDPRSSRLIPAVEYRGPYEAPALRFMT